MSTQADLDALAASVRFFVDQEIPNVTQWNVDPDVLKQALTRIGVGFTDVEATVADVAETMAGITNPDGTLKPVSEWIDESATPTYVSASMFTLPGDRTTTYRPGHRLRATVAGGSKVVVTVQTLAYSAGTNITTFTLTAAQLDAALSKIAYSVVRESAPAARTVDILDAQVTEPKNADNSISTRTLIAACVTAAKIAANAVVTAAIADGAVTNLKVGFKSLQGTERIVDNSINGSVSLTAGSVTGDKVAPGTLAGGHIAANSITGAHVVDKSLWAASELADYSVAWHSIARGHVRGSWSGGQNEIGQKTIWGDADIADLSITDRNIAANTIWINNKCANKSMLGYNSIVDGSVQIAQIAQGHTTAAMVGAGTANGALVGNGGWAEMGAVQFNISRYGWVHIMVEIPGWVVLGGTEGHFYAELRQNNSFLTQRHWMSSGGGVAPLTAALNYFGWWGPGNYRLSILCQFVNSAWVVYSGTIYAIQFA